MSDSEVRVKVMCIPKRCVYEDEMCEWMCESE